jgi:DNA-binding MarR family transcriptional regulator
MPRLEDLLCFGIYAASHAFNRVYKPLLEELDLTYPQYWVLVLLWEQDNQTVSSLGERLFLASNTLTPLLKRLEVMELVKRQRQQNDERQVKISLTNNGKALKEKATQIPSCILEASGLTIEALTNLNEQITNLRKTLAQVAIPPKSVHEERGI